jgi:CBS domain-containing protein
MPEAAMRAKDVMSSEVMSLSADATVYEAAEILVNAGVSAMTVLDDSGFVVGLVSEADLIGQTLFEDEAGQAAAVAQARSRKVVEIMTKNVVTIDENASLREVAQLLLKHHIKRVPILRDKAVVGMVSRIDLLKGLLSRPSANQAVGGATAAGPAAAPGSADARLRGDVVLALHGQSWSQALRSDVVVDGGVVHLWGIVPNEFVRQAYADAVRKVPGVKAVESHMQIQPTAAR